MKILKTDVTLFVCPSGHQLDEWATWSFANYIYQTLNMSDDFPLNYTEFNAFGELRNIVDVRTSNSEVVGIAGTNAGAIGVYICDGVVHDGTDVITDGTFQNWESDGTPTDWTVQVDAVVSEGTESIDYAGYSYTKFLKINFAFKHTIHIILTVTLHCIFPCKFL